MIYRALLRTLGLIERRCAWCGGLLGWRRGPAGKTTHGICGDCCTQHFGERCA